MANDYLLDIVEYFHGYKFEDIDSGALQQVKRGLLDYLGCSIYAAKHDSCPGLMELIAEMAPAKGVASVWAEQELTSPALATFANAARTSNIELDDGSGIGASVHPGVYVWSAALAAWEHTDASVNDVIRAVVFGYDVCLRMGLLATDQVRELGLHGPGLVGGLAAAATAGLVSGLNVEQLYNAISITASLLPVCPFISFLEGADAKDFYGGWGAYLAWTAVAAAEKGLTGPARILDGPKSLSAIFAGKKGKDVAPGAHFYIKDASFKEFPACYSVHPAMGLILDLQAKHDFKPEQITSVSVAAYPYAYELHQGVGPEMNPSSARLSLSYTVAYMLIEGELSPAAFTPENIRSAKYQALGEKITVKRHDAYGAGPFAVRGTIIEIQLLDGTVIKGETSGARWSTPPSDDELINKFSSLVVDALDEAEQQFLIDFVFNLDQQTTLQALIDLLRDIN